MFPLRAPLWSRSRLCRPTFLIPNLCRRQTRWLRTKRPNTDNNKDSDWSKTSPWIFYPTCAVIFGAACFVTYQTSQPFRHSVLALVRCSRAAGRCVFFLKATIETDAVVHWDVGAAILSAIDYKMTMLKSYETANDEHHAYSECHTRSAKRVLKALLANGGSELVGTVSYLQVIVF